HRDGRGLPRTQRVRGRADDRELRARFAHHAGESPLTEIRDGEGEIARAPGSDLPELQGQGRVRVGRLDAARLRTDCGSTDGKQSAVEAEIEIALHRSFRGGREAERELPEFAREEGEEGI